MTVIGPSGTGSAFLLAGHFGPEAILDPAGNLLVNTPVIVNTLSGPATLYTDKNKTATFSNPINTNGLGNLSFYADPGDYSLQLVISGVPQLPLTITVEPDPSEIEALGGISAGILAAVATADLPAAGVSQDGRILIEDAGAGDQNLIFYSGGGRYRIDGGTSF